MVRPDQPEDKIVPDPAEALEFQSVKRSRPKRRGGWIMLLVVLAGAAAGAGWFYYGDLLVGGEDDDIPVIRAAEGPVKVRPKTPGGMAIPDRDKLVYNRMKGGVEEPRIERLLPVPEMPKTPPVPKVVEKTAPAAEKPAALAKPQKLEPGATPPKKTVPKTQPPAVVVNQDMMPKIREPKTEPPLDPAAVSALAYQVQIAAVRSRERALIEWERLKKKHTDLLAGYSLNIVRADLGADKGVFFRLRAGPIAGEDVARALCKNLSERKVGCLIVRPGG